jgi:methylmalonyl-CoA mutase cobalamin-binding domain/chain
MNGMIPKVLVTKIGFDGHDRGSRVVAAGLRDAGMEVIYTPPWQEIAAVVKLALEEDVDVIGISSLATDHLIVPRLLAALREATCSPRPPPAPATARTSRNGNASTRPRSGATTTS